jgi:hypothetical protein
MKSHHRCCPTVELSDWIHFDSLTVEEQCYFPTLQLLQEFLHKLNPFGTSLWHFAQAADPAFPPAFVWKRLVLKTFTGFRFDLGSELPKRGAETAILSAWKIFRCRTGFA